MITFIKIAQTDNSGGSLSVAFSAGGNTAGNCILAIALWDGTPFIPSVTDTRLNQYKPVGTTFTASNLGGQCAIFLANGIKGGPNTVQLVTGGASFPVLHAAEYSGVISAHDRTNKDGNSASPGTVSMTSTNSLDLLVAALYPLSADGTGPAAGCTQRGVITTTQKSVYVDRPGDPAGSPFAVGATFTSATENYMVAGVILSAGSPLIRARLLPLGL